MVSNGLMNPDNTTSPFKRQPHKMVKHTQTIRQMLPTSCLSLFDHFVGLALKWLKEKKIDLHVYASKSKKLLYDQIAVRNYFKHKLILVLSNIMSLID